MRRFLIAALFVGVLGASAMTAGETSLEAGIGLVLPTKGAAIAPPTAMAATIAMRVGFEGNGWVARHIDLRPRIESVWGGADYIIGDQRVHVDQKTWVAGGDICYRMSSLPTARLTLFGGAGYAAYSTNFTGTYPETKHTGRAIVDGGLECMPVVMSDSRLGIGLRFRHVLRGGDASTYDNMGIYVLLQF